MDLFYVLSSVGFVLVAITSLLRKAAKNLSETQRLALWIAAACFVTTALFLAFLSLQFDFGACINPSRERPYFFQGRLMAGGKNPFAMLYIYCFYIPLPRAPGPLFVYNFAFTLSLTPP